LSLPFGGNMSAISAPAERIDGKVFCDRRRAAGQAPAQHHHRMDARQLVTERMKS
jgi:hypothetical protein